MQSFSEKLDDFLVRYLGYFNYNDYIRKINLKGPERVLEIGSGGGNLSRFIAKNVKELVCIDNCAYWINKSKKRLKQYKNIKFKLEDISKSDYYKNYFDIAVIHFILHDIKNKEKTIENIRKSLKNKGKIYIREPTRKEHGIFRYEIKNLMKKSGFQEQASKEKYSLPLRGKVYEGVFFEKE